MGPHETEMRRLLEQGWESDARAVLTKGGAFAGDYCAEITAQRDALAARVAELEEALSVPPELLTHMLKLGEVEWGSVPARSDEEHISDFRDTLQITRETFGTVGAVPLDGVYLQGTATVVCHTGTSPNSPMTARIVAGLWNHFLRTQSALARTPAQSIKGDSSDERS